MSTRGPQRWCPECSGQIYFHHADPEAGDVWYCQGCGKELAEEDVLKSPDEKARRDPDDEKKKEVASGRPHR